MGLDTPTSAGETMECFLLTGLIFHLTLDQMNYALIINQRKLKERKKEKLIPNILQLKDQT